MLKPLPLVLFVLVLAGCNSNNTNSVKPTTNKPTTGPSTANIIASYESQCDPEILEESGDIEVARFDVLTGGEVAEMRGAICDGTLESARTLVNQHALLKRINFIDVPGSLDDDTNLAIAKLFYQQQFHTHVSARENKKNAAGEVIRGGVASGGTDLFLSGSTRSADLNAFIGVHSWAEGELQGHTLPPTHPKHQPYIQYYKMINLPLPEKFYFFTLEKAAADDMHYMTRHELLEFQLITQ